MKSRLMSGGICGAKGFRLCRVRMGLTSNKKSQEFTKNAHEPTNKP